MLGMEGMPGEQARQLLPLLLIIFHRRQEAGGYSPVTLFPIEPRYTR